MYPDITRVVVPGLSTVQKCRIRSPAAIPEGRFRDTPVPIVVPYVVFWVAIAGYEAIGGVKDGVADGVWLGVDDGVLDRVCDGVDDGVLDRV